jgi:hypothetical protein
MNDRERKAPAQGSPHNKEAGQAPERLVLTPPTAEQENYLKEVERSTGKYNPDVIVGGPRVGRT